MVQYYVIANLDKREFLHPDAFGPGQRLMEFACDRNGVMMGLAILLASSNGMGGGDLRIQGNSPFVHIPGRWAGDRIVVAGDYDDNPESPGVRIYKRCCDPSSPLQELAAAADGDASVFENISYEVLGCMLEDATFREDFCEIEGNPTDPWHVHMKAQRQYQWITARPNDPVPASLR